MSRFLKPVFDNGTLELRYDNNEVCIYGTREGLLRLCELIKSLVDEPKQGHIHLEDYCLLTARSLIGAVAIFEEQGGAVCLAVLLYARA